jgi:molybdenum cofactor synthesis domain-containing protein
MNASKRSLKEENMCDQSRERHGASFRTIPLQQAVGTVLAHDITEIRAGEFKGRAFRKGHIIKEEDVCHLQRLGKEHLFVLQVAEDEMHEDDAVTVLATALMGAGVRIQGEPKEGKINIVADRDGLLSIDREALLRFNMLGEVMCATLHSNTVVKKDQVVAGTRTIPLVVKKSIIEEAVRVVKQSQGSGVKVHGVVEVKELRRPKAGIVITGNEVYHGKIKDAFATIIAKKIEEYSGEIVGIYYAPDDERFIEERLRELIAAGADLLITTGGMSVDPDDVTRFAIRNLGATDLTYGSAVLPGAMFLAGYIEKVRSSECGVRGDINLKLNIPNSELIPILGIPACGMYHRTTIFDLILPRVLAGELIGRKELAELGYGGLCLNCKECRYPVCPFGKP